MNYGIDRLRRSSVQYYAVLHALECKALSDWPLELLSCSKTGIELNCVVGQYEIILPQEK